MAAPINVVLCCALEDQRLRDDLAKHLKPLVRNKLIRLLHEQHLDPGLSEVAQLRGWADAADVILLLLSKDLIASLEDNVVAARGLERYRLGEVRLIPVILYKVPWREDEHFGNLVPLPRDGRPVGEGSKSDRDSAFVLVVEGVKEVAKQTQSKHLQVLKEWRQLEADLVAQQLQVQTQFQQISMKGTVDEPAQKPNSQFSRGRALVIGVGADLPTTVNDAKGIYDLLIDESVAGYPRTQVTLLTEKAASGAEILAALEELGAQSSPEDTVFIYFSGHGWLPDPNVPMCYLVPNDYFPMRSRTALISGAEFARRILAINSRKLLLFLDCCFAGAVPAKGTDDSGGTALVKSVPVPMDLMVRLESGTGRVVVASSQPGEISLAGNPYSVFTSCLLDALSNPVGPDGYVRVLDVLKYLFESVPQRSGGAQHPYLTNLAGLSENFVLCHARGTEKSKTEQSQPRTPSNAGPERGIAVTRTSLRQLLDVVLHNDARLEAFCSDEHPEVKRQFGQGMQRDAKVTLLLEAVDPVDLLRSLEEWDAKKVELHRGLLKFLKR